MARATASPWVAAASTNRASAAPTGVTRSVASSALPVRGGAGTRYRALGLLSQGQSVTVLGTSGDWSQISFNGSAAYVHSSYLSANRPSTGGSMRFSSAPRLAKMPRSSGQ